MYCNRCGEVINEDSSFCNYCGAEIIIKKDSLGNVAVAKIDNYPDSSMDVLFVIILLQAIKFLQFTQAVFQQQVIQVVQSVLLHL